MITLPRTRPLLLRNDPWRSRLEELLHRLSRDISPEECHEIRESLGRLATWLRLGDFRSLRDRVKTVRRAIGPVRDLDVVLERVGPPDAGIFGQERRRRSETLRGQLTGASTAALQRDLRDVPAINFDGADNATRRLGRRVRKAGAAFAKNPTRRSGHRLRRRLREFCFAREWLGLPTSRLKPLIRHLGRLNDDALARTVLRGCGAEPADSRSRRERAQELKACLVKWKSLQRRIRNW